MKYPRGFPKRGVIPRRALVDRLVPTLHNFIMLVDEKPTLTRPWTFNECVYKMLFMKLIGAPRHIICVAGRARKAKSNRIKAVLSFFDHPSCEQYLKRTALACQELVF